MDIGFWEDQTSYFFPIFTSIEAYLYFSDETELLQGQEGHRLTLFIFCFLIMSL